MPVSSTTPAHTEPSGLSHAHQYIFIYVKRWSFSANPPARLFLHMAPFSADGLAAPCGLLNCDKRARLNRKEPTSLDTQSTETFTHMIGNRRLPVVHRLKKQYAGPRLNSVA